MKSTWYLLAFIPVVLFELSANGMPVANLSSGGPSAKKCGANSQFKQVEETSDYFHKTAQVDDADRKTADEYGAVHGVPGSAIEAKYSGSADIHCGGMMGQAQLVVKNDVIVTAAHALYVTGTCTPRADFGSCYVKFDGRKEPVQLKPQGLKSGYKCPNRNVNRDDDWAVIQLVSAVDSKIKPYRVSSRKPARGKVVAVGKSKDFYRYDKFRNPLRHYGDCETKDLWGDQTITGLMTNCDSAGGSSGGGLFTADTGEPELLGINSGVQETDDQLRKDHVVNAKPFDVSNWSSVYIPVTGEFLNAIQSVAPFPQTAGGVDL